MDSKNTDILSVSLNSKQNNLSQESESIQLSSESNILETLSLSKLNSIEARLSFLEKLLSGNLPILEIPTAKTRAKIQDLAIASQSLLLPKELYESLTTISNQEKVSLYCILLTSFQILLYRYTNQTEIIIGTPIKNKNKLTIKNKFDIFDNISLLPLQLNSDNSFNELIQILQITLDAQTHQSLAINSEIAEILLQNSKNQALFQVLFELQNLAEETLEEPNWEIFNLDLILKIIERPEGLSCSFTYNSNLFETAQIARMMSHVQVLLESIVAHPDRQIATLDLLTPEEKTQIVSWNNTQVDYPDDQCIHQLFERQVAKTPEAIALIFEEQQLTYQELNQRANALAHYLQEIGVKAEVLVGICVERSLEMVIANLAILKAGGAYLPLDSTYPQERLDYIIQDAQISLILTQNHLQAKIASCVTVSQNKIQLISLDSNLPSSPTFLQSHKPNPSNLAYVIYTSGSTGKPKGVEIPHRALVNFAQAAVQEYEITQSDRIVQFASISFDASIEEIYPCLIAGGTLVLRSEEMGYLPSLLLAKSCDYGITILDLPTAFWHLLTAELANNPQLQLPPSIRLVIIGGEAVNPKQVTIWNRLVGTCQLINTYGPTETTVVATSYKIPHQLDNLSTIPIGRPLPNLQIYILDKNLQPVPVGVPGEIYIGGAGLARGYLNRPKLTAEKFVINPFTQGQKSKLLYKTGDLARYLADGKIDYLGRIDNQVKIRGFRIELGEIESVILQYPGVQAAAVIVQENATGYQRLVAYLVNQPNVIVDHEVLRHWLQQQLPAHMMPSGFMTIDALPLTLNGKVDPKALPRIDFVQTTAKNYLAPNSELEIKLTKIWEKVLEIKPIGIKNNFLELGGNSLLAMTLVSEIEQTLQQKMPLNAISSLTTVEQMASCFAQGQPTIQDLSTIPDGINSADYQALLTIMAGRKGDRPRPNSLMVAMQNQGSKPPLFLCANAYEEAAGLANYLGAEQPFYLMESGYFTLDCNGRQIKALATHHLEDILAVQPQAPYFLAGYSTGGLIAWEIAQQLRAMGKEVALLAILDTDGSDPMYENYQRLNYTLPTQLNKLANLQMIDKLKYLGGKIATKAKNFSQQPTADLPTFKQHSDPYVVQPYPGKVSLFLSAEAELASFFSHKIKFMLFPRAGWAQEIAPQLTIEQVPGDHLSMLDEPNVQVLATKLKQYLE
ncbi:non-ribosomal peptide synthetase [Pleurocapsa sp. CCALA 161]|uniref:non-ribosomal peptide synthetase n=1 Tax=Pleurocapsa sp. CCALA 161 TaxID=2107688 RepID=UPI000D0769FD|nr:amino acid adenylation domain-containing protein [Pleurocapsa sp. CCALA 161]PSB08983.1 non-ribosomal peptide synthetase [Pleurocapsa sp. CCALA 161]